MNVNTVWMRFDLIIGDSTQSQEAIMFSNVHRMPVWSFELYQ